MLKKNLLKINPVVILLYFCSLVLLFSLSCIHPMYFTKTGAAVKSNTKDITLPKILDDFDNGDLKDALGGVWEVETDEVNGGNSSGVISFQPGKEGQALRFDYTLGESFQYRYCIAKVNYENTVGPVDLSAASGIKFFIKGNGKKFRFNVCIDKDLGYNWHGITIDSLPSEWKEIVVPFSSLKQEEGWGKPDSFDPKRVLKLEFRSASQISGEKGFFLIDNVSLIMSENKKETVTIPKTDEFLLADFEQTFHDRLGNLWSGEDDSVNGGNSIVEIVMADGQGGSRNSAGLKYTLGPSYQYRYAILKTDMNKPVDFSKYDAIAFWIRGSGNGVKLHLVCPEVTDYDYHEYLIKATTSDWKEYVIPFNSFQQEGWGKPQKLNLKQIIKIQFQTASQAVNEQGWFNVDNIRLISGYNTSKLEPESKVYDVINKDESEDGCFLGIFGAGYENNPDRVKELEKKIGKKFASVMFFLDWKNSFPVEACEKLTKAGYVPHICWEPWFGSGSPEKIDLDTINSGKLDDYITSWAKAVKNFGKPVMIRTGHEFNGNWYPWSVPLNGMDPDKYIKFFRRVVNIFRKEGANNAIWLWCPMNQSFPPEPKNQAVLAYPGDDYVDWIAIDGYNFGTQPGYNYGWASFRSLYEDIYYEIVKKIPSKPLMIGEFASGDMGGDKVEWILNMGRELKENFPAIKMITWFNINKETDWRIDAEPKYAEAFHEVIKDPYFLTSAQNLLKVPSLYLTKYPEYQKRLTVFNRFTEKQPVTIFKATTPIVIDGNLSEWQKNTTTKIIIDKKEQIVIGKNEWQGIKDLSATIMLTYDQKYLYIAALVTDDFPLRNKFSDGDLWQGDAIEFVFGTDPDSSVDRRFMDPSDAQIGLSAGYPEKGMPPFIWYFSKKQKGQTEDIKAVKTTEGYIVETRIPWKELAGKEFIPTINKKYGMTVAIDDADNSDSRDVQAVWFGNENFYRDPSVWNQVEFK